MNDEEDRLFAIAVENLIGESEPVKTHMSNIFLGKNETVRWEREAVKNIRAEDFGFVDMRPLEKRKENAMKYAAIDAAYSPDLHTRIGTYVLVNGTPRIAEGLVDKKSCTGTSVKVLDYVVIMRRFDSRNELRTLYEKGGVTEDYAIQVGRLFADAHRKAETNDKIASIGHDAITGNWEECFRVTADIGAIGLSIRHEDYEAIKSAYRTFVDSNHGYFEERKTSGFIRQCHGDGHSGNMFVEDGRVKIFDGISFKDEFSYSDVITDFAFPYMDAVAHGRKDLAEAMKKAYIEDTGDAEGIDTLLDFSVAYRAFVRGEVTTMRSLHATDHEKEEILGEASRYFLLAKEYALLSVGEGLQ